MTPAPRRVLIVGAGEAGRQAARAMRAHSEAGLEPVGFVDDDAAKLGTDAAGVRVHGAVEAIGHWVRELRVDEILIAVPSATGDQVRRLVRASEALGLPFKIVPGVREIILGDVRIEHIRDVEPDDLLGRESVDDEAGAGVDYLAGRRVLVTGAGGTIGAEICRQLRGSGAQAIVVLGRGENSIFEVQQELTQYAGTGTGGDVEVVPVIADVRDGLRLQEALGRLRPDYVFHAAAHKHVRYMEAFPGEAVLRNVVGTANVLRAAAAAGVRRVVFVSTDKAAAPENVMGASKRLGEELVRSGVYGANAVAVRFGNVLGSRGSVVPLFKRQIARGGPVTVSHPDVTRYFMTVREAAFLVLRAGAMGEGGEVYLLDMGRPISILELARQLIVLSGFRPETDVAIEYTGLLPGERLHERLVGPGEEVCATSHPKINRLVAGAFAERDWRRLVEALETEAVAGNAAGVRRLLADCVPSFASHVSEPPAV